MKRFVALTCILAAAAVDHAAGAVTNSFGWENGATIIGAFGNLADPLNVASNRVGTVLPHGGSGMLQITEAPHGGTPQAYVAYIENLQEGDLVTGRFWGYDDTPSSSPSMRIWGHYATNGNAGSYTASAGGNNTYTSGIGWEQTEHTWTVPAGEEALVVEVRLYSSPATDAAGRTDYWVDDIEVIAPAHATVTFPQPVVLTIDSPADESEVRYDTAFARVHVTASSLVGALDYINETLDTTQRVAATEAAILLAEGTNLLTVAGSTAWGETVSDRIMVVRDARSDRHIALAAVGTIGLANGAEIVAFDAASRMAYVTTPASGLMKVDLTNPAQPLFTGAVLTNELINSVAVHDGLVAVAVESGSSAPGQVVFLDAATGAESNRVTVGIQPDNLVFSPDGSRVVTADEAETGDHPDYGPGSISVIDLAAGVSNATVTILDFTAFDAQTNALREAGVRIFPGRLPSLDFEPECVAVSPDGRQAFVTLQENNAFAIVDLTIPAITEIVPLGLKDWSLPENTLDASDRDGGINMANYPVFGLYMPDMIASFVVGGKTYYVTANEGDSRDYLDEDEERVKKLTLDPVVFPNAAELQRDEVLGRLKVTLVDSDPDQDGDVEILLAYGARSFSIWNDAGAQVYDSADNFESYLATERPELFNIDGDLSEFDMRSDDKGCEPEAVEIGVIDGVTYAFIGLERVGGIMVYNVTNPQNPSFVEFARYADDRAPEGMDFVAASDSPSGKPLLLVANEGSSTLTVYEIDLNDAAATTNGTPVTWLAQYGLTEADDALDADGDGLTTAQEFALSLHPRMYDTDGDLLPDGYEIANGLDTTKAATLFTDSDGDGQSDLIEHDYGTNPADSESWFVSRSSASNGSMVLNFHATAGHQYVVQESDDLEIWHNGAVVSGADEQVSITLPTTSAYHFFHVDGAVNKGAPVAKICIISDPHYMAPSLLETNENSHFQTYLAHDRKLIEESHAIMVATVDAIIAERPDVLLVSGDMTKDGEWVSHQAVSNFFAQIEAAGIAVLVCPGNHDINNTNSVKYVGFDSVEATPSITPEQYVVNYRHCGYDEAISRDAASLSFVAEPVEGLWIMSVDSSLYIPTQVTAGEVSAATLGWMKGVMAEAAASNKTVLAMMHHGVVPHYTYQPLLFSEYLLNNHQEVAEALVEGGVGAVFTGHYHANDVVKYSSTNSFGALFDIETGSTVTWPCPYRVIFLTADGVLNVGTKRIEQVDGFDDFQGYAENYLQSGLMVVSEQMLIHQYGIEPASAAALAPAMTETFMAHYAGDEGTPGAYTQQVMSSLLSSTNATEQLFGVVMQSIWNDPAPADNNVILNIRTGGAVAK
jgi:hypothetical protein